MTKTEECLKNLERVWKPILDKDEYEENVRLIKAGIAEDIPNNEFIRRYHEGS